jgi:hypothetical protein
MKHGSELDWLEEQPFWKKTIQWFGWLVLSLTVAAGFADAPLFAIAGFICVWCLRLGVRQRQWGTPVFLVAVTTIAGVCLFLIHLVGPGDQSFWYGFTLAAAVLGSCIFLQIRKAKNLQEELQHEIYYSEFEWYRKQRFEEQQKEYDEWQKKHPNK